MNIDWALCQALKSTFMDEIVAVVVDYDVNCEYMVYLPSRVANNPHLHINPNLVITAGIGLLHVMEHKPQCVPRYAPTYIRGAGQVAGEIIESLWSGLNGCAKSTRTATNASRAETLDDHMNDNNWSKLINIGGYQKIFALVLLTYFIVETVCKQYRKAVIKLQEHREAFEDLTIAAGHQNVEKWTQQGDEARRNRRNNIKAMDIFMAEQPIGKRLHRLCGILIIILNSSDTI